MKNKPIENPKFMGCATCSPQQTTIISKDRLCAVGFGNAVLIVDGVQYDLESEDPPLNLGEVEQKYIEQLKVCKEAEIVLDGPLHGETFELNTENGNWYLTKQNQGFA